MVLASCRHSVAFCFCLTCHCGSQPHQWVDPPWMRSVLQGKLRQKLYREIKYMTHLQHLQWWLPFARAQLHLSEQGENPLAGAMP